MIDSFDFRQIMDAARGKGFEFNDSDSPGAAVEKVCDQMGIPHADSDLIYDKALEIREKLNSGQRT